MEWFYCGVGIGVGLACGLIVITWIVTISGKSKPPTWWADQRALMVRNCEAQERQADLMSERLSNG